MTTAVIAPDERALRAHLDGGAFRAGVAAGRWRLLSLDWPVAIVAVTAAARPNAPTEFALRLILDGYPNTTPTGGIWDVASDTSLAAERRPKGERVAQLFRTDGWTGAPTAMYAPWDRVALDGHADWAQKYPLQAWNPSRDLTFLLEQVHEVLNTDDYLGT